MSESPLEELGIQPAQPREGFYPIPGNDLARSNEILQTVPELAKNLPPIPAAILSVYDARPINGSDFLTPTFPAGGQNPFASISASVVVPNGSVFVLRNVLVEAWFTGGTNTLTDTVGRPLVSPFISVLRNGTPVVNYSNLPFPELILGAVQFPTYVIANGGDILTITLANNPSDANYVLTQWNPTFYGNVLLDSGLAVQYQAASTNPIPVSVK